MRDDFHCRHLQRQGKKGSCWNFHIWWLVCEMRNSKRQLRVSQTRELWEYKVRSGKQLFRHVHISLTFGLLGLWLRHCKFVLVLSCKWITRVLSTVFDAVDLECGRCFWLFKALPMTAVKSHGDQLSLLAWDWEVSRRDFLKCNPYQDMLLSLTTVLRDMALGDQERDAMATAYCRIIEGIKNRFVSDGMFRILSHKIAWKGKYNLYFIFLWHLQNDVIPDMFSILQS